MVTRLQHGASPARPLDVKQIVNFFGGRDVLAEDLEKHSIVKITAYAVDKWVARGVVPTARLEDLKTLARMRGLSFELWKFKHKTAA